jgi:8-oxo-dGTP pyrophosphatase MutT (NUDIX family)
MAMSKLTIEQLRQALQKPLPGIIAQKKMAPRPLPKHLSRWTPPENHREAAVLLLLYPHITADNQQEWHIVLTRRHEYPGVHGGQISFPGGQREAGESLQTTALREAHEEVGTSPEEVDIVGSLSPLYTPPSNFCIHPYVGYCRSRPQFQPDPVEVAELIEPHLSLLQNPALRQQELWPFPDNLELQVPFFNVYGHKIWGATAMILNEFLMIIK